MLRLPKQEHATLSKFCITRSVADGSAKMFALQFICIVTVSGENEIDTCAIIKVNMEEGQCL